MEDPGKEYEIEQYPTSGPGEEYEIEQYSTPGPGVEVSESKISRIFSGGLWLGKIFLITGFVISSAPVVLPPLVVVSVLGFAVSIPFGVVFAGYACTEKLMSKLLPIPQSYGNLDYEQLVKEKEEEDVVDAVEEFAFEAEEKAQIQDTEESVEMRIELAEDPNSAGNVMIEGQSHDENLVEGSLIKESEDEKPEPAAVTRVVEARPVEGETESGAGKSEDSEVLKEESIGSLEKIKNEGKSGVSAKKNKKKNKDRLKKCLGIGGKKEDKSGKDTKQMEKSSESRQENLNKFSTEEEDKNIEISGETMKDAVLDDKEQAPVAEKPNESHNMLNNENRSKGEPNFVDEKVESEVGKKQGSQGHGDMSVESNAIRRETTGNGVQYKVEVTKVSTEISSSEKNLWEQINAIRLIVGYKAKRRTSLTEELKDLYVFTGVEPPSSFQDSANYIEDAEDKLRFLMSIVGVK